MQASNLGGRKFYFPLILAGTFLLSSCRNMIDQPRYEPLEASEFFSDARSARPLVEGAVPWSTSPADTLLTTGRDEAGELADVFPMEVTQEALLTGQQSYNTFCAPCHGFDGHGQGMIVQRGFSPPPSLHEERLRDSPVGYYFDVITNGFGRMYAYDYRIPPGERWAVIAYIRALQLSQNMPEGELPPEDLQKLQEAQQ